MARFNFNLRDASSEEATPINFVVRWANRRLVYPSGEAIAPKHWCNAPGQRNHQRAKETKAFPEYPEFNARLDDLLLRAKAAFRTFVTENGRDPEVDELRAALDAATGRQEVRPMDLLRFIATYIASEEGRFNSERNTPFHRATLSRYAVALGLLQEYAGQRSRGSVKTVPFSSVDADFIAGFTVYLTITKGYAANTVVKYGRSLRLFLRRAREAGHSVSDNVFSRRLALKEEPSDQIYLNEEELSALYHLDLSKRPGIEKARDLFVVGAWTGLRFGDLSRVQPEHIEGNFIRIPTAKTGKEVKIPLHPYVRAVMAKYGGRVPSGVSNQKQNDYIKEASALVPALQLKIMVGGTKGGIRREVSRMKWSMVTTHTARRSFASNLYRSGVPARTIMAVTGHTTEQSFMRYIRLSTDEHMEIIAASPLFSTTILNVA